MAATDQYEAFAKFARESYEGCTLEQKLQMYLNHHPIRTVAFLLELVLTIYPNWPEETHDSYPRTD